MNSPTQFPRWFLGFLVSLLLAVSGVLATSTLSRLDRLESTAAAAEVKATALETYRDETRARLTRIENGLDRINEKLDGLHTRVVYRYRPAPAPTDTPLVFQKEASK